MIMCLGLTQIPGVVLLVTGSRPSALGWVLYGLASLAAAGALFVVGLGRWRHTERIVALIQGFAENRRLLALPGGEEGSVASVEQALRNIDGALRTLEEEATHDPLTGAFNRRCSATRLNADLSRSARDGSPFSIAVFDLDELKTVNDRYGHIGGDAALRHLSEILQASVREGDWVSRWGGDEFLVGLWNADEEEARHAVARIHGRLSKEPLEMDGERLVLSATAGVAQAGPEDDAERLFVRADTALMGLKKARRGRPPGA